jgi:hypothetical protein
MGLNNGIATPMQQQSPQQQQQQQQHGLEIAAPSPGAFTIQLQPAFEPAPDVSAAGTGSDQVGDGLHQALASAVLQASQNGLLSSSTTVAELLQLVQLLPPGAASSAPGSGSHSNSGTSNGTTIAL